MKSDGRNQHSVTFDIQTAKIHPIGLGPLSGEVRAGEILHLVGPNGAGKSTLLARMAGMTSGKGSIQFAGQPLEAWSATKLALHRAYLSQQQTPPES